MTEHLISISRFAERFIVFIAVLFSLSASYAYGPTIPKEQIPHDISAQIRGYISSLYSMDPRERGKAVLQLDEAGIRARVSIPFLISMLSDVADVAQRPAYGNTVASYAAYALSRMGEDALEHLLLALHTSEPMVRVHIAGALGLMGNSNSVEPLIGLLQDPHKEVRLSAAEALGLIRDERAIKHLIAMLENDGRSGKPSHQKRNDHDKISCPLSWADETEVMEEDEGGACSELESAELLEFTREIDTWTNIKQGVEDRDVLMSAAKALAGIGETAVGPLLAALRDPNQMIRAHAAATLSAFPSDRVFSALRNMRTDPEAHVRGHTVESLAKMGDVEPAMSALVSRREARIVRLRALIALQNYWAANNGLDEWLPKMVKVLNDSDTLLSRGVAAIFRTAGPKSTALLKTTLMDSGVRAKILAALILGSRKDLSAVEHLINALEDEDPRVRAASAKALGMIGDHKTVEKLIIILKRDESQPVRRAAAKALGDINSSFAAKPLTTSILEDESRDVAWAASKALADLLRDSSLQKLLSLLEPHFTTGRSTFLRSFQQTVDYRTIGESETIALAIAIRAEDEDVREFAAETLAKSHDPIVAAEALKSALNRDASARVRRKAISSLGQLDVTGGIDVFLAALEKDKDAGVRKRAVIALGLANDRDAIAALTKALNDEDRGVRAMAAMQLSKQ